MHDAIRQRAAVPRRAALERSWNAHEFHFERVVHCADRRVAVSTEIEKVQVRRHLAIGELQCAS